MIPPLDPAGILMAAASAALFTVALVYVVRSKAADAASPLTSVLSGQAPPKANDLFADVFVEPRSPARGLALSVTLHILVLAGAPLLPYLFPEHLHFDFRRYNVKIMEFRIPDPLLYAPPKQPDAKATPQQAPKEARARSSKPAPKFRVSQALAASRRTRLQLPWEEHAKSKDVVIQPDQPPNVAISIPQPLPSSFLWAQQPTPAEPWRLVGQHPKPAPPKFTLPHSTPVVEKPNREATISDLQIASGHVLTFRDPQLPVFAANVAPVQMPVPGLAAPGELPATALPGGSPLNLITLMNTPATPATGYVVEEGNRLADSFPGSPALPGGGPSAFGVAGSGAGSAIGSNQGQGNYADLLAATGNSSDATGNGTASGSADASGAPNPPAHPWPTGGNLGVIIVQQSSEDSALEGGEVLTGQPIYTVYFDVPGAPRRWILQYCVPGAESRAFTSDGDGVIHILPHRSVQPPFPLDRIPLDLKSYQGDARRLVVYATVDDRGETENVRVIRGASVEIDAAALATLKRWPFRPAMRGDTPVTVQALFGIPLQ